MNGKRYLIRHARIVTATRITVGDIRVEDGRIAAVGRSLKATPDCEVIDADGLWALPGFIDLHCHGGALFDATLGRYSAADGRFDGSPEAFERGTPEFLAMAAEHGTTAMLVANFAADVGQIKNGLSLLARYAQSDRNGRDGAMMLGFFLEGTFIKRPEFAGAQNSAHFRAPSRELFDELNAAASGLMRYVNVVPEHGEIGLQLIKYLSGRGVLVGAGHTGCTADEFNRAVDCGLKVTIHFTNGPTGGSYKPFNGGGAVEAVLRSRRVFAELITDGCHVNPAYVMDIIKRKGHDRIAIVTDGMFPAGARGLTEFTLAGIRGRVSRDGRYLEVAEKVNTLFGSVLTMDVAFGNLVSWLTAGLDGVWTKRHRPLALDKAVLRTSRMMSRNPAELLGIFKGQGSIAPGKRADILLAKIEGDAGAYRLRVRSTLIGGRRIARR